MRTCLFCGGKHEGVCPKIADAKAARAKAERAAKRAKPRAAEKRGDPPADIWANFGSKRGKS